MANWLFNFIVSLTFLLLIDALGSGGAFLFYAAICVVTFFFCKALVPGDEGQAPRGHHRRSSRSASPPACLGGAPGRNALAGRGRARPRRAARRRFHPLGRLRDRPGRRWARGGRRGRHPGQELDRVRGLHRPGAAARARLSPLLLLGLRAERVPRARARARAARAARPDRGPGDRAGSSGRYVPQRMKPLLELESYRALAAHHAEIAPRHLRDLFAADPDRGSRLTAEAAGLYLDYSKNRITDETIEPPGRARRRARARGAPRGDVPRRAHQRHRGPRRCSTSRCGCRASAR